MCLSDTLYALLVRRDRRTLDPHIMLENGVGSINSNLVIGSIAIFQSQVIGDQFDIHKWQNQLDNG